MKVVVAGAGGHARSVLDALRGIDGLDPHACTDPRPQLAGTLLDGVRIVGGDDELPGLLDCGVRAACLGIGGTHDNGPRRALFEKLVALGFVLPAIVHARAARADDVELGAGTVVLLGACVGAGSRLGQDVIVNTGAIVEHDCVVADHVHVATGAILCGAVTIETAAHVGAGAVVLQGRRVGARAVVGAGAVVVRDVPAGAVVVGCPASERDR